VPRGLDDTGRTRLREWAEDADPRDVNRVKNVLYEVAHQHAWKTNWNCRQFPGSDDWIVYPRDGLVLVVREFSDEDPESAFSIVSLFTETPCPPPPWA